MNEETKRILKELVDTFQRRANDSKIDSEYYKKHYKPHMSSYTSGEHVGFLAAADEVKTYLEA